MKKYVIVAEVKDDDLLSGVKFSRKDWPLHITVLTWFKIESEAKAKELFEELVKESPEEVPAKVGKTDKFGELDVSLLESDGLKVIHNLALDLANKMDAEIIEITYIGKSYRPHITHQKSDTPPPRGTLLTIQNLSLVESKEDSFDGKVIESYCLEKD